jgi:hypothetical protein
VDLAGVRFSDGITFDFTASPVRYLSPGGHILVVGNLGAFRARYGSTCDGLIAGVYAGNLANNGERMQLVDTNSAVIRDFFYDDDTPWPETADGDGPSLVLRAPAANPDHANATNWTVSVQPGGMPSGSPASQTFAAWRGLLWNPLNATNNLVSGPAADPDGDGACNYLEYVFGSSPFTPSVVPAIGTAIEEWDSESYLVVSIRYSASVPAGVLVWEQSPDLAQWTLADASLALIATEVTPEGYGHQRLREVAPLSGSPTRFFRLRIIGP